MAQSPLLFVLAPPWLPSRHSTRHTSPRRPFTACEAAPAPASAPAATLTQAEVDKLFSRLTHVNKNLRVKASAALAESASSSTIARLVELLSESDTAHRRAAVQALGMTGMPAVPAVLSRMSSSDDATVRASCAKMLAAVALYFPEERETFPDEALDALEKALADDPDPVTKLASVGALGTLGSDVKSKEGEGIWGNDRAVDILIGLSGKTKDMAVGATAVGAIAQIGQNGTPERKERIQGELRKLCQAEEGEDDNEEGFNYVREMAVSHLEQLEGGPRVPDE